MELVKVYYATEAECKKASADRMKLEIGYDPDAPTQFYWDWGQDETGWYVLQNVNPVGITENPSTWGTIKNWFKF